MCVAMKRKTQKQKGNKNAKTLPARRACGTMTVHSRLLEMDPSFGERLVNLERLTSRRMLAGLTHRGGVPTTIPVFVHVVHNTESENISDAQVKSQISRLNLDYAAKNPDRKKTPAAWNGLVTDARIQFVLAAKDPKGGSTSGITRTKTTKTSFSDDDSVKSASKGGADAWPTDK